MALATALRIIVIIARRGYPEARWMLLSEKLRFINSMPGSKTDMKSCA